MRTRDLCRLAPMLVLVLAMAVGGCWPSERPSVGVRPECPEGGLWSKVFAPDGAPAPFGATNNGELALSDNSTNIVEFHDCQQFIVYDSAMNKQRYSSLFAIFARTHLDSAYRPPDAASPTYDEEKLGTPMATIFSFDSAYVPLGIKQGFNCLYFFKVRNGTDVGWEARVVPVATEQKVCTRLLPKQGAAGTPLAVSIVAEVKPGFDAPPPVTRWDWDATTQTQYIGIRCGLAWCEVHPNLGSGVAFNGSVPIEPLRPYSKGWYDEQILAVADQATGTRPEVSAIVGTFVPDRELGKDVGPAESSRFATGWRRVASVAIRGNAGGYTSKLNLVTSGENTAINTVWLCYVTPGLENHCTGADPIAMKCSENWFGAVEHKSVVGAPAIMSYFCVIRRGHEPVPGMPPQKPHPPIPGVVRWRWAIDDETMWVRCLNGCCEIKPHV